MESKVEEELYTLMNNNERLDSIVNSSLDGIMSFDSILNTKGEIVDFIFTFSNTKACEVVSKTQEELLGEKLSVIVPGNFLPLESLDGKSLFSHYKNVVLSKKPVELEFYFEYDGIREWFRNKAVPCKNGFTVTFMVITKEKELEAQSILSSKGLMLDAISHQWRQPLAEINSILFKLSYLIEQSNSKKELLDEVNKVENITKFLSNTLDDFHLNLFSDSKKQSFSLCSVLNYIISLFETSFEKHKILLENRVEDKGIVLQSYPNHLKHVLFSILQNSKEAFGVEQKDKKITISNSIEGEYIVLSILDNGGGVDDDIHLDLIQKNFSTKKDGSGLGLYLSNLIVTKLLEGTLKIYNKDAGLQIDIFIKKEIS